MRAIPRALGAWRSRACPTTCAAIAATPSRCAPSHLARQPFGQAPAIEDDGLVLFESGAIALYIAEKSEALMPKDRIGRARATAWVFSALNSVEIAVQQLGSIVFFHKDAAWAKERRPQVEQFIRLRLGQLAAALGEKDYLEGCFTVGDLMMSDVLRIMATAPSSSTSSPRSRPTSCAAKRRPAFQRARCPDGWLPGGCLRQRQSPSKVRSMKVYVFKSLPPFLWGYTRDIRALWALEECGISYETIGLDCEPAGLQDNAAYARINPFKQVPAIDDDGYVLTESGAILLYLAEKSGKLIPGDLKGRAQVYRWLISSLNNIEPFTLPILFADMQGRCKSSSEKACVLGMSTYWGASSRRWTRC